MSDFCHICGQHKQECPTVICAPCALMMGGQYELGEVVTDLRTGRTELAIKMKLPDGAPKSIIEVRTERRS